MEAIKDRPPMERPREKLTLRGAEALSDAELLAILLSSGTPGMPLHLICQNLLRDHRLSDIADMDIAALCQFKGIGPAKATILLAAAEYCHRLQPGIQLADENACYSYFKPILAPATQLQYVLLLISERGQLLAFAEVGSGLPDITRITELAINAGARRIMLGRNSWPAFSNTESSYLENLRAACAALGIICGGLMAVGPERFKMI
jgi:DNA repair protein RadC